MIIVNSKAGGRGNRLVTIAHAMALAIERNDDLLLTAFGRYAADYRCEVSWDGKVVIRDSMFWDGVRLILAVCRRLGWNGVLHGCVVSDWTFRAPEELSRHEDVVRKFFTPVHLPLALQRSDGLMLVAVHIRRTDYRDFKKGVYYYDDSVYARIMSELVVCMARPIRFVVFSDEQIEERHFADLECQFMHGGAVEEQWQMGQCDLIVGPPSTFSAWAGFMGKVPTLLIPNRDYFVRLKDVKYRGLYV